MIGIYINKTEIGNKSGAMTNSVTMACQIMLFGANKKFLHSYILFYINYL